jgi:hypothetical protein
MPPAPPALRQLSQRLRYLREAHWPDARLTQSELGKVLGGDEPLSPATVASWENKAQPKLPPRERILVYAQFFATPRSVAAEPRLLPVDTFTEEERAAHEELKEELLRMHAAARGVDPDQQLLSGGRSWHFADTGPVTLVCAQLPREDWPALASPGNPNYTELESFADLDAMVELHGHIRAENPAMDVFYKAAPRVAADDLSGHVVLIGGIGWNDVTKRFLDMTSLPVRQISDPAVASGEIFATHEGGAEQKYFPAWANADSTDLTEDVGLLARLPNQFNSNRTMTICNGIHSRGVLGAVRSLTDARLRESNEEYIARAFRNSQQFCILMRIQVIEGHAMTPDFNIPGTVLYQWPGDRDRAADRPRSGPRP